MRAHQATGLALGLEGDGGSSAKVVVVVTEAAAKEEEKSYSRSNINSRIKSL